jgi:PAS domain S-box-containing protein
MTPEVGPLQSPFARLFEFSPDVIIASDPASRITEVNSQAEDVFGYTRAEPLVRGRFRPVYPPLTNYFAEEAQKLGLAQKRGMGTKEKGS